MSIVSKASKAVAKPAAASEASEFDGFWINAGVYMGEEGEATTSSSVCPVASQSRI